MCFPIYRSSLDQKYLTQLVQNSTCLMWTGLKIKVHAWGRRALRDSNREWAKTDHDSHQVTSHDNAIVGESVHVWITCHDHDSFRMVSLVFQMFPMGRASHLFWGGGGGGRGASKRKTKSCIRKDGEKIGTQGSMEKRLCKSHLFLGFV